MGKKPDRPKTFSGSIMESMAKTDSGGQDYRDPIRILADAVQANLEQRKIEFEWTKSHAGLATKRDLDQMEKRLNMTSAQLETLLNNQTTQIGKISKEQSDRFDALSKTIKDLQDLIAAGGAITPEIETAATNVQKALDDLDASIPDAVPTPNP